MARKRQVILLKLGQGGPGAGGSGGMEPLGTCREIVGFLAPFNTAPDGSGPHGMGEALGMGVLHGPGFVVEMPSGGGDDGEVAQLMVTVSDEDFAWAVLMRLCKHLQWKMLDPDSGRTFG